MQTVAAPELIFWTHIAAAIAFTLFAVHLGVSWRGGVRGAMLMIAILLSALWSGLTAAFSVTSSRTLYGVATVADTLRAGAWLSFIGLWLKQLRPTQRVVIAGLPLPSDLLGLLLAGGVTLQIAAQFSSLAKDNPRLGYGLSMGQAILVLVAIEQFVRNTPAQARWGIKSLAAGVGAAFAFDVFCFSDAALFGILDGDLWGIRGAVHGFAIPAIALSAARNPQWRFRLAVSRRVVFHSAALLAIGIYLIAIAGAGYYVRYFGGEWGRALQATLVFAAALGLVFLAVSGSLRARLRVFISKHFFSYRYDYREVWLKFTSSLSAQHERHPFHERVILALSELVESPGGRLWLKDDHEQFVFAGRWNASETSTTFAADDPLTVYLTQTGWVIDLHQWRERPDEFSDLDIPRWLAELPQAWLLIPLIDADVLVGVVILAPPRTPLDLDWEVTDLLKTAGRQAASYINQIRTAEALLESRKFESFNRLSAFVVHDLKNLVAQLSLLLSNAHKHRHNPEFQADMLETIEHVTDRMRGLLMQLREGNTPIDQPRPIAIHPILQRIRKAKSGQRPEVQIAESAPISVIAHEDRLERVIGHLVQNALDATAANGTVAISASAGAGRSVIEISDTGCGMSEDFLRNGLFKAFRTTKPSGMGIGAYESLQYVRELGGSIDVESKIGSGTRIRICLPSADESGSEIGTDG